MTSSIDAWKKLANMSKHVTSTSIRKLYKADGLLAISKPYNISVHGGPKMPVSVEDFFPDLEKQFKIPQGRLALAHRLDKNVSGVLLLSYTNDMAEHLAEAFRRRRVHKTYLAVLNGILKGNHSRGILESGILEKKVNGRNQMVVANELDVSSKLASTEFRVLDNNKESCTLCEFKTNTGYKHQIRVHATELMNAPILGDHKYHHGPPGPQMMQLRLLQMLGIRGIKQENGKGKIRPWQRALVPLHLFAQRVTIPDIRGGPDITIEDRLPDFFKDSMESCDLAINRDLIEERRQMRKKVYKPYLAKNQREKSVPLPVSRGTLESAL